MPPSLETQSLHRREERIPLGLQSVFLASNRGKEVHQPPPGKVASKTFSRLWPFRRSSLDSISWHSSRTLGLTTGSRHKHRKKQEQSKKLEQPTRKRVSVTEGAAAAAVTNVTNESSASSTATGLLSPQAKLDAMLRTRGYSTRRFKTLQSAYYNKPTPLQQASHHARLVELIRQNRFYDMGMILSSGVSPNPCNEWGESLVHMVCRRGDHKMLNVFLKSGSSLQVVDDFGRTPLHDACWATEPCFEAIEMIIQQDPRLLHMTDCRDSPPLAYVQSQHWHLWHRFLDSVVDQFWPPRNDGAQPPPSLVLERAHSRPLLDPPNALSLELAKMVVSGKMTPAEAQLLRDDDDDDKESIVEGSWDDDDDDDDNDEFANDFNQSTTSIATFCEDEMESILANLSSHTQHPVRWSHCSV